MAALIDRLLVLLIPLVGVIYPLLRILPALYGFEMQRRIFRLYGQLRSVEREAETRDSRQDMAELVAKVERLEDKANHLKVSLFYTNMVYVLRSHISSVRQRLQSRRATGVENAHGGRPNYMK